MLRDFEDQISAGDFGTISSLLVIKDGQLVYERYPAGENPDELHRVYSVTKSVTSLVAGIALANRRLTDVSQPILDFFSEYTELSNPSPSKAAITFEHVLQMRAGFEWDELSTNYANASNPTVTLIRSPDWTKHVLDLPMAEEPGTQFVYNSGVSMLMSGAISNSGPGSAVEYAGTHLFEPLGIDAWRWDLGPLGLSNGGWGLWLTPRDMAALGQLALQNGEWDGMSVVPSAWIQSSATASTTFTDGTGYGYQWWLGQAGSGVVPGTRSMAAWGWGGQFIVVLPTTGMVLVSTAENYEGGGLDPSVLGDFGFRAAGAN